MPLKLRHYKVPEWKVATTNPDYEENGRKAIEDPVKNHNVHLTGPLVDVNKAIRSTPYFRFTHYERRRGVRKLSKKKKAIKSHFNSDEFDPMPTDRKSIKNAGDWMYRFGNPHTYLGQIQMRAVELFEKDEPYQPPLPLLEDATRGSYLLDMMENYPIFVSLVRVCEMDSLVKLMSTCRYLRHRILHSPLLWHELDMTSYTSRRRETMELEMRFDACSLTAPGRAGIWSGSPIHITAGMKRYNPAGFELSSRKVYDALPLLGLPTDKITKLNLDGLSICNDTWVDVIKPLLPNLTHLSVRWCRLLHLKIILIDVLGLYDSRLSLNPSLTNWHITDGQTVTFKSKLRRLQVWGCGSQYCPHVYRPVEERMDGCMGSLACPAGSSRFSTNSGEKALFIDICKALNIVTDFGSCSAATGCWNEIYVQEGNPKYPDIERDAFGPIWRRQPYGPNLVQRFEAVWASPGYLALRTCSRCEQSLETHLCRECEDARSCYICKAYVCKECDPAFTFATIDDRARDLPEDLFTAEFRSSKKYCASSSCNLCVRAGRFACSDCNTKSKQRIKQQLEGLQSDSEYSIDLAEFCPISIPIDTSTNDKRHLSTCGLDGCRNPVLDGITKTDTNKYKGETSLRCACCAIALCNEHKTLPCQNCPVQVIEGHVLCPPCTIRHTCTCNSVNSQRRTPRRAAGKAPIHDRETFTHQPFCPVLELIKSAKNPANDVLRWRDGYVLPGGEAEGGQHLDLPKGPAFISASIGYQPGAAAKMAPCCRECQLVWWEKPEDRVIDNVVATQSTAPSSPYWV